MPRCRSGSPDVLVGIITDRAGDEAYSIDHNGRLLGRCAFIARQSGGVSSPLRSSRSARSRRCARCAMHWGSRAAMIRAASYCLALEARARRHRAGHSEWDGLAPAGLMKVVSAGPCCALSLSTWTRLLAFGHASGCATADVYDGLETGRGRLPERQKTVRSLP